MPFSSGKGLVFEYQLPGGRRHGRDGSIAGAQDRDSAMAVWWSAPVCRGVGSRKGGAVRRWLGPLVLAVSVSLLVESAGSSAARLPLPVARGSGGLSLRGGASALAGVEFVSQPVDTPWRPEPELEEEPDPIDQVPCAVGLQPVTSTLEMLQQLRPNRSLSPPNREMRVCVM